MSNLPLAPPEVSVSDASLTMSVAEPKGEIADALAIKWNRVLQILWRYNNPGGEDRHLYHPDPERDKMIQTIDVQREVSEKDGRSGY